VKDERQAQRSLKKQNKETQAQLKLLFSDDGCLFDGDLRDPGTQAITQAQLVKFQAEGFKVIILPFTG
jgi:hypothetical protein